MLTFDLAVLLTSKLSPYADLRLCSTTHIKAGCQFLQLDELEYASFKELNVNASNKLF